jgi:uncharacterized protein YbjT (DUF2867 family)
MAAIKQILITGATGKQGGALIDALLKSPPPTPFHLVAMTRNAQSAKAQSLSRQPNVSVLEGDLDNINEVFAKSKEQPFFGVFSVQTPMNPQVEEKQGKALVDAAAEHGVKHFVYTSAERGGQERSDRDSTLVKHFISKFNIEKHLQAVAGSTSGGMQWTIIRPVAFMDNMTPDFLGRAFVAMWRLNGMDTKLQLVSSRDIGILAADVFKKPDEYVGRSISFATDELTPREAEVIFRRAVGKELPSSYSVTGRLIKLVLREQLGQMFDWFKEVGFGADPKEFRDKFPEMQSFERWLEESSGWKAEASRA